MITIKLTVASSLLATTIAHAQPTEDTDVETPSAVAPLPRPPVVRGRPDPFATTERWGGGIRLTGLSGIGALPGVNFGAEVAGLLRRDELFGELALGRWKPEETYLVTAAPVPVELALDVWTVRCGWASMKMPLGLWGLAEVGEVAGARAMPGVVTRMVMGNTPRERQWMAIGGGFGVAWPMSPQIRLVGNLEIAVPVNHDELMLDRGTYNPDPVSARYSLGLEVGWR